MSNINKYHNQQFETIEGEDVPSRTGDRRYAQDRVRDFWYQMERAGFVLRDIYGQFPALISGGVVTQGAGSSLDITAGYGYAAFEVDLPDDFASLPPSVIQADVAAIRIAWALLNDINASNANCSVYTVVDDGATPNYVKMRYKETDGNTRDRAKYSGTYAYEIEPDFDLIVDGNAPTDYDILLATFTSSGGTYTITDSTIRLTLASLKAVNDYALPVGSIYIQLPSESTPASLFGGTWSNISSTYAGNFFRAEGGDASAFEAGTQADAMQRITGRIGSRNDTYFNGESGAISIIDSQVASGGGIQRDTGCTAVLDFDSANSTSPNPAKTDDTETRPTNETVRIWKRTA